MGNVWKIEEQTELTSDEIMHKIMHKINNTRPTEGIIVCCSHPKLTENQEDMLVNYRERVWGGYSRK
jgi:hypothetical protein